MMATNSQVSFSWPLHAMAMIERFSARIAARPYIPDGETAIILNTPQCVHNCDRCFLECAVAPARLKWWQGELARACGSSAMGRA